MPVQDPTPTSLRDVQELELLYEREVELARVNGWRTTFLALALGLFVVAFLLVNYMYLKREFSEKNLKESLTAEMQELSPTAVRELGELGEEVLPVYVAEFRQQLVAMGPALAKRLESELDLLTADILEGVDAQLRAAEGRVLESVEAELASNYPELHDEVDRELFTLRLKDTTEDSVTRSIAHFHSKFSADVEAVQASLLELDLSDGDETALDLQKEFLHLWLQLLDEEIMAL